VDVEGRKKGRPFGYPDVPNGYEWVCIDFDGTIAERVWPDRGMGEPIPDGVAALKHYKERGFFIGIYTARSWNDHAEIMGWLQRHGLADCVDTIVCGKPVAGLYIDDRAWHPPWTAPHFYEGWVHAEGCELIKEGECDCGRFDK
jgi:hypothetical protein